MKRTFALCNMMALAAMYGLVASCSCSEAPWQPVSGGAFTPPPSITAAMTPMPTPEPTADPSHELEQRVEELLSQMTPQEKVGQLFVISFQGPGFTPEIERLIQDLHPGGILIFAPNVSSVSEVQTLIVQCQGASLVNGAHLPLFVAMDHEGGIITRLGDQATQFPSNMALGASRSLDEARLMADAMADELRAMGVNMTLGPVLDVNTDPTNPIISTRSFGSDPHLVATMGTAMIQCYQQYDVIPVAKHFPGHGSTAVDSHISLPRLDADRRRLDTVELLPFQAATAVGVDAIMTAHIAVPALDETERPATLSSPILNGLLRQQWGFEGLIATDSLGMGAIGRSFDITTATIRAFEAGADLLMFGWDTAPALSEIPAARDALLERFRADATLADRLDGSVRRILRAKARRGILDWQPPAARATDVIRSAEHLRLADQIAQHSVTLLRDEGAVLPLAPQTRLLAVYPESVPNMPDALGHYFEHLQPAPVSMDPDAAEIAAVRNEAAGAEAVVVATLNAMQHSGQAAMVQSLTEVGLPLVVVALRSPYDLLMFPDQSTYVAIYGETPPSVDAMARLLCGEITPRGLLPVELPGLNAFGDGLTHFVGT